MSELIINEAAKPNAALEPFQALIGTWSTTGTHPLVPDKTFHGRTSFSWIAGGAFVVMQSEIDEPEIPSGIAMFGTDDTAEKCSMIYFDERGVSRVYAASMKDNVLTWSRDDRGFSQRFSLTIDPDGLTMASHGQYSRDRGDWEPDLQLNFTRIESRLNHPS